MNIANKSAAESDIPQATWVVLDEAQQVLLQAESIVVLLGAESGLSEYQSNASDVASDLLRKLKTKLSDAQEIVRNSRRRCRMRATKGR